MKREEGCCGESRSSGVHSYISWMPANRSNHRYVAPGPYVPFRWGPVIAALLAVLVGVSVFGLLR